MKKSLFTLVALLFTVTSAVFAQSKITEGKVTYSITLPNNLKDEDKMIAAAMGKDQVIYFKGTKSRAETKSSMGEVVVLTNSEEKTFYTLMNMMGKKIAMKAEEGDMEMVREMLAGDNGDKKSDKPEVKITKETKKIAGYKCTKALVTYPDMNGEKMDGEVWFTDEVGFVNPREFKLKEINGFPMEFTYGARGMKIKMTCTGVEAMKVSDDKFVVPEDYTVQTMMEMMSGGMGFK